MTKKSMKNYPGGRVNEDAVVKFSGLEQVYWKSRKCFIHGGSYMSANVLLNLLKEWRKRDKMRGLRAFELFFATSLINSIIQEHKC